MGLLTGQVAYERYEVTGPAPTTGFNEIHLEQFARFAITRDAVLEQSDGVAAGFIAGEHVLDFEFTLEKNVLIDALAAAIRLDVNKIPGDLLRAYQKMELASLASQNPSGHPTRAQKQQAKEAGLERAKLEAAGGRFRRMKMFPFLWDARAGVVHFGGPTTAAEHFSSLFERAFACTLAPLTAGGVARRVAEEIGARRGLEDLQPTVFAGPARVMEICWVNQQFGSHDYLGNEFLLWLWWILETRGDTLQLTDGSTVTCMLTKSVTLHCPANETGRDTISSDAPTQLPEAKLAVRGGKLPRKIGMILVRHNEQVALTLQAETLAVSGAALPRPEDVQGRALIDERVEQIRRLAQTIDMLFGLFCRRRLSTTWTRDVEKMRLWLSGKAEEGE